MSPVTMVVDGFVPSLGTQVDELTRYVAQVALWLAALPPNALRSDPQALDTVEQMAQRILKEVAAIRLSRPIGETRGAWRVVQPGPQ